MKPLKVSYDKPETVAEMLNWLVDSDPIELRDLADNLLDDVETLKAELQRAESVGFARAVAALRDRAALERKENPDSPTMWAVYLSAADYLEYVASDGSGG